MTVKSIGIVVGNDCFIIVEDTTKKSADKTLVKIEYVIYNRFGYSQNSPNTDPYKKMPIDKVYEILQEQARLVYKAISFIEIFFPSYTIISQAYKHIQRLKNRASFLNLPKEVVQEILKYLSRSDLGQVALVNSSAHIDVRIAQIEEAKKLAKKNNEKHEPKNFSAAHDYLELKNPVQVKKKDSGADRRIEPFDLFSNWGN